MGKYNYDKTALKGLGVGDFLGEVKERERHIAAADTTAPQSIFNSNKLAASLHPKFQVAKIAGIKEHKDAKEFLLEGNKKAGTDGLAYFRAGQYVSVVIKFNDHTSCRPYTICSGPKNAIGKDGKYSLLVKKVEGGAASEFILKNWDVGQEVMMSGPLGHFYYQDLRDAHHVVALAGGSGITPFFSMASAIANGQEDFRLTILYGSKTESDILLKDELEALVKRAAGKLRVVHVLSDEKKNDYENGFITSELIKKYAGDGDYSVFVCGPPAMYKFCGAEIEKLGLPRRRVRLEVPGEALDINQIPGFPKDNIGKTFSCKVKMKDETVEFKLPSELPLMRSLENAGVMVPSDCRSGECGWCHSRLIKGDVFIPEAKDKRRMADKKFNWIHPCCTYPASDLEIEVYPVM